MKIFKFLIPKDNAQEVTIVESYCVSWYVKTGWSNDNKFQAKVFTSESDAQEFKKQLISSANLIGCWINVELTKN